MTTDDGYGASAPYESKVHKLADAAHRGACATCDKPVTSADVQIARDVWAHSGACAATAHARYAMGISTGLALALVRR